MKKCIVISDSFKGTLSSTEIAGIAQKTIPMIFPDCKVDAIPIADGGEGTVDCFLGLLQGQAVSVPVSGPWPDSRVEAVYGRFGDRAVIEMAAAAGLPLVGDRKDPSQTTTYGVGQLISHAITHGCREIILGLGGSCTNDGGCGCAAALGTKFYNAQNERFLPVGATLDAIKEIDHTASDALLRDIKITIMSDVENPLYGPSGAASVFAPQKGADPAMTKRLDQNLRYFAQLLRKTFGQDVSTSVGAGAAGGMGAGCLTFLHAEVCSGIDILLDLIDFEHRLEDADLVITGEGRIDSQSLHGKVISGISKRTRAAQVPLIAIVGSIDDSAADAYDEGVTAMFSIDRMALPFSQSAPRSEKDYRNTLLDVLRLIKLGISLQ